MPDVVEDIVKSVQEGWKQGKEQAARRNVQLSYWSRLFEGLSFSPQRLFRMVADNLKLRKVPDLELQFTIYPESGILSSRRLYLQMRRERLVFEIGAGPFGSGFFVSSRLFERRREAGFLQFFVAACIVGFCGLLALGFGGWIWATIAITGVIALFWSAMRLASMRGWLWLHRTLPDVGIIGPIYQRLFWPFTYHRQDQSNCYCAAVHASLMQAIDEMTNEQGARALEGDERKPFMKEFYR